PFLLVVVSNNYNYYLKYVKPFPFPTCYEDWSVSTIGDRIRSCEVTIVPNPLNRFTLMKSANRTILSLFHGVPVVATRTSALEPFEGCVIFDSWVDGIITYLDDPERARRDVAAGRAVIQSHFSGAALADSWQALFDGK